VETLIEETTRLVPCILDFQAFFRSTLQALRFGFEKSVAASFSFESSELQEIKQTARLTPAIQNNVGHDGIAMAGWECHDLTTLALDRPAFIGAIIELLGHQGTENGSPSAVAMTCAVRWGSTA
jgi:hypothetical protein